jgi:hypothetical protein
MARMTAEYFGSGVFEIAWPRWLMSNELDRLLELPGRQQPGTGAGYRSFWEDQVEQFFREAFVHPEALEEWQRARHSDPAWLSGWNTDPQPPGSSADWLRLVRQHVQDLPVERPRPLYWTQRQRGDQTGETRLGLPGAASRVASLVVALKGAGYLAWAFGQECVDGDSWGALGEDPAGAVHTVLGRESLWPPDTCHQDYSADDLFDVVEFLADHIRRPTRIRPHDFNGCGPHYEAFDQVRGLQVYRWRLNEILDRSSLGVTLGEHGRLERTAAAGVEDLVTVVRTPDNVHDTDTDELHHALEQFRTRGASVLDRRQAVITLAGILERRRDLLKTELLSKDEGALFTIANGFAIRHQKADQRRDYDAEVYLEWIFYWYLATIHLTNRITADRVAT